MQQQSLLPGCPSVGLPGRLRPHIIWIKLKFQTWDSERHQQFAKVSAVVGEPCGLFGSPVPLMCFFHQVRNLAAIQYGRPWLTRRNNLGVFICCVFCFY